MAYTLTRASHGCHTSTLQNTMISEGFDFDSNVRREHDCERRIHFVDPTYFLTEIRHCKQW